MGVVRERSAQGVRRESRAGAALGIGRGGTGNVSAGKAPQQEGMPYPRMVLWMDRDRLTPRRLDFDAADGTRIKTLALDVRSMDTRQPQVRPGFGRAACYRSSQNAPRVDLCRL